MSKKDDIDSYEDTFYNVLKAIKQIIAGSRDSTTAMNLVLILIKGWEREDEVDE